MSVIDTLIERNADFAAHHGAASLPIMPKLGTMVISCADPRVDPAYILGLELGDAVVIRNIGGRIVPSTLHAIGMLGAVAQAEGINMRDGLTLIVLHHTDCGITRLTANTAMLSGYFGIGQDELAAKAVADPHAAVAVDVAALHANPALPATWIVSGLVYAVETGRVETVVPPALLHATAQSV